MGLKESLLDYLSGELTEKQLDNRFPKFCKQEGVLMPLITKEKCYTTRLGKAVRLYDFWPGSRLPVIGALEGRYEWEVARWTAEGKAYGSPITSSLDLIEVPCENKTKEKENEFESNLRFRFAPPTRANNTWRPMAP